MEFITYFLEIIYFQIIFHFSTAQRLGRIIVKVALAKLLLNFNVELNADRKEIEIANFGVPIMAKGGINVRLSKRKTTQCT